MRCGVTRRGREVRAVLREGVKESRAETSRRGLFYVFPVHNCVVGCCRFCCAVSVLCGMSGGLYLHFLTLHVARLGMVLCLKS